MYVTLRNGESIIIESTRHKMKVATNRMGEMTYNESEKEPINISDKLMQEQVEQLMLKNDSWGKERLEPTKKFLIDLIERGSKALKVDKNKLATLIIESCDYSAINYFQEANYYNFQEQEKTMKRVSELGTELWNLKKEHEKEVIRLQKELTALKQLDITKIEVIGSASFSQGMGVNCPFCDHYQELGDMGEWSIGEEYDSTEECDKCGKPFSVKSDGSY